MLTWTTKSDHRKNMFHAEMPGLLFQHFEATDILYEPTARAYEMERFRRFFHPFLCLLQQAVLQVRTEQISEN
jgi:hypothetical protein